eukprot:6775408-Pyramimonas_sp.AAC.1
MGEKEKEKKDKKYGWWGGARIVAKRVKEKTGKRRLKRRLVGLFFLFHFNVFWSGSFRRWSHEKRSQGNSVCLPCATPHSW